MLDILDAPKHVAAFRISEEITGADYERIIAALESKLSRQSRIAVYVDMSAFTGFSVRALGKDLRYALAKRRELDKFARTALVTDKPWLRLLAHTSSYLLPSMRLRVFPSADRDVALAWSGALQPTAAPVPGLRLIPTTRPDTLAFAWDGHVTEAELEHVAKVLNAALDTQPALRLLARIEHFGGVELGALLRPELLRVKLLGATKVERYAVVGGPGWLSLYARAVKRLVRVDMRHFATEHEQRAWGWLEAQPSNPSESTAGRPSVDASAAARSHVN